MKYPVYPFSAIVGQEEMKLTLLLAAVDWRISVLLRGDKGAGKTTTARGLATLLPSPARSSICLSEPQRTVSSEA
jgi:magnesium chelatase subunit D